ncbi:DUF2203 domain-containing protein [Salsuginibacillus kocurii]|uniref:DUF2203 domain-containing protein n=1 Tax=Salsuginibacillus kocurii TaxID=427078 RepID=UPI0003718BCB|nr:DUF2203 domain-containing protein [Salsuginibacillus kocurii]
MFQRYFTIAEANAWLPQVKELIVHLQSLKREFEMKMHRLENISAGTEEAERTVLSKEDQFLLEASIDFLDWQAKANIEQFEKEGILIKGVDEGLVDFPAMINGDVVLLCWRQGEEFMTHYHGVYEGFIGRKSIEDIEDTN